MSSCFIKATDEIVTSSDYTTYKKRKQIYKTMAHTLDNMDSTDSMGYLRDNRNYKVKKCLQHPGTKSELSKYVLSQAHSYAGYLDMVRGKMYNQEYVEPHSNVPVPQALKYKSSLGSFLLQVDDPPFKSECDAPAEGALPKGLIGGHLYWADPVRYLIPDELGATSEYMQEVRAQPTAGFFLHRILEFECPPWAGCGPDPPLSLE